MNDFLKDRAFLEELNKFRIKEYHAAIAVLDFRTETPITRVEGRVANLSMSLSKRTPTRRTGSMSVVFDELTRNLTDLSNLFAIDKKISLSIGITNFLYNNAAYRQYGDILWFKQGTFVITGASSSVSSGGASVNLQFIDKMGKLNGVCGGTLPSQVSFHDRVTINGLGDITVSYPTIRQIVYELVHHFGGEHPSKIIINDIPEYGRQVVTWAGTTPVWFAKNSGAFVVSRTRPSDGFPEQKVLGDDIGYMSTPLTYPGELIMKSGATVSQVLDEIVKVLGEFEYFYDVDGFFHFKRINDFNKTGEAPAVIGVTNSLTPFNISGDSATDNLFQKNYLPVFREDEYLNEFSSTDLVGSISFNPNYSQIKNDLIIWGTRKAAKDDERMVRYHLAIDEKPKKSDDNLIYKDIYEVRSSGDRELLRYYFHDNVGALPNVGVFGDALSGPVEFKGDYNGTVTYKYEGQSVSVFHQGQYYYLVDTPLTRQGITGSGYHPNGPSGVWKLIKKESIEVRFHSAALSKLAPFNWREELYRKALRAYGTSIEGTPYDAELMAEWRKIFNPTTKEKDPMKAQYATNTNWGDFKKDWDNYFGGAVTWNGYNVDVIRKPQTIGYWLDIIDTNSALGQYSVQRIGRRSAVKENNRINEVLNREVPDIVFVNGKQPETEIQKQIKEYQTIGQAYCIVKPDYLPYFELRNSFGTCYEEIRDMLYQHTSYNSTVSMNTVPILYLDVNKVMRLNFPELGVVGNYIINDININIGQDAAMSIQLNEIITVV